MWVETEDSQHRQFFARFCETIEKRGHVVSSFVVTPGSDFESWVSPADAYIVRSTAYIDQAGLSGPFAAQLAEGKRVLWLARDPASDNPWTVDRFDLAITEEQHFVLSRYVGSAWNEREDLDQVVARPATPFLGLDLLRGVSEVVLSRPNVVRVIGRAKPFLEVALRDLVDRSDLKVPEDVLDEQVDSCVAGLWAPLGVSSPQMVMIGDGDWLVDDLLARGLGDNLRFAENLIDWLAGGVSSHEMADAARQLANEIELIVWEVGLVHLTAHYGAGWPQVLSLARRNQIRRLRPDTPWERALDPGDKVTIIKNVEALSAFYAPGGISRTRAKSLWARVLRLRVRLAHVDHLPEEPVTQGELDDLLDLRDALIRARRGWYRDRDPE
jgi:hypothetical protein